MKILMLVNWKILYRESEPKDRQPPDYYIKGRPYWFYRYFDKQPEVDVVDISSFPWLEKIEKNKIRFYIWQTIKVIPKIHKYDLVVSHGMQSGVVLSLLRRIFKTRAKHIVFDIGSFNSAAESGCALKLMQFASKSIDGVIYHSSSQIDYYKRFFPWIVAKSKFIKFGTDLNFFHTSEANDVTDKKQYIICVGYTKRDWDTLVEAYKRIKTNVQLRLVGRVDDKYKGISGVEQVSFLPINDLISQIHNALFAVLPLESFNYSYGQMTLMQQMALGKCVVAARVPSLVDYVEDGKTAILYKAKDIEELSIKLNDMLNDNVTRRNVGMNGRKYLHSNCNEKIMASEIEDFYERIVYER